MHDMRKKALNESLKKTSRKARNRPDSLAGSNNSSRQASNANSRAGSRYASEDEDSGLSSAVSNLRLKGHSPAKAKAAHKIMASNEYSSTNDESDSDSEDEDDEMEELDDEDLIENAQLWQANFRGVLATLEDRKANGQDRAKSLIKYRRLLRVIYSSEAVAKSLSSILEQLLKSVRKGAGGPGGEKQVALECLSLTMLSCDSDVDAMNILEQTFTSVKHLVADPDTDETDKSTALQTLAVLVAFGSGLSSTGYDMLDFFLKIVESDGASISSPDSGAVVTAAIHSWNFMSSLFMPAEPESTNLGLDDGEEADIENNDDDDEDDENMANSLMPKQKATSRKSRRKAKAANLPRESDEESEQSEPSEQESDQSSDFGSERSLDEKEGYFELQGQRALDAFLEQLESTDSDVLASAGSAIALIYEASRSQEEITGRPLELQQDPLEVVEQFKELCNLSTRSVKSIKRQDRREIKDIFRQLIASLEYGVGPEYAPHAHKSRAAGQKQGGSRLGESLNNSDDDTYDYNGSGVKDFEVDSGGYNKRVIVGDKSMPITTWRAGVRVDTFRAILGEGMTVHMLRNRKVRNMVWANRLRKIVPASAKDNSKDKRKKSLKSKVAKGEKKKKKAGITELMNGS
ncbi:hypothetical protein SEUCBS140593_006083 [Sporothrix eucalyptigena]|uniref:Interferon-related developmental regulator N-terminal domain-containing protein n=1 Tax=Sporothrix eucalyptigena TaxID=1812306 RepID=A0ABP0C1V4_9PEZI